MLDNGDGHQVAGEHRLVARLRAAEPSFLSRLSPCTAAKAGFACRPGQGRCPRVALAVLLLLTPPATAGYGEPRFDRVAEVPAGRYLDAVAAAALAEGARASNQPASHQPTTVSGRGLYFTDVTVSAGVDFRYTFGDYAYDNILESSGSGVTWFDADRDGDLDLYLLNGTYLEGISDPKGKRHLGSARNRFYRNEGDGRFVDRTAASGLGDPTWGMAAVAGDFDDDGLADLFVANYGPNRLFRNNGDGTFTDVARQHGLTGPERLNGFTKWTVGGSWLDADGDGDLDLAVCNFLAFDPELLVPGKEWEMPEPREYDGQPSQLFMQREDGVFIDVTEQAALYRPDSKCMGMTVLDVDRDGRLDILQTNDHQPNFLFRAGPTGRYVEIGTEAGLAVNDQGLGTGSMHATPGDVNGDGLMDFLVVDLRHGSLYLADDNGLFIDATWASGLGGLLDGLGQWGAGLVDFDLDGDLDLFTANGVAHILVEQFPMLAVNDGGSFLDARDQAGDYFQSRRSGRGAAFADFDNDGDVDIVVNHVDHRATAALLRNDSPRQGGWMAFDLVGRAPRTAYGARLTVTSGERAAHRVYQPTASYLSGNDPRLHVGLGANPQSVAVRVDWPRGTAQRWHRLPTDHRYTVYESGNR